MHVVIDCDPGIDDAVVIALALSRQNRNVKVEAITVVDGNTNLANALLNVAVALKKCGRTDIPIYKGSNSSLLGFERVAIPPPHHIHGETGMGTYVPTGHELDEMNLVPNKSAAEGLIELARKFSGTLHLIALAPLTNIALAMRLDPTFPQHLASLFIMGGDYGAAVKRYAAEFNFLKDPEAANIVMREAVGHCPVTLIPYDTCYFSTQNCDWDWFDSVVASDCEFSRYIHKLYVPYRSNVVRFTSCDGIAMSAFLLPGAIEADAEFFPPCSVQLDHHEEPVKTQHCPGGQRGCLVLAGRRINSTADDNDDDDGEIEDGNDKQNGKSVAPQPTHHFGLRIVTRINEHMFKAAFAEAINYYSQSTTALPHHGY